MRKLINLRFRDLKILKGAIKNCSKTWLRKWLPKISPKTCFLDLKILPTFEKICQKSIKNRTKFDVEKMIEKKTGFRGGCGEVGAMCTAHKAYALELAEVSKVHGFCKVLECNSVPHATRLLDKEGGEFTALRACHRPLDRAFARSFFNFFGARAPNMHFQSAEAFRPQSV